MKDQDPLDLMRVAIPEHPKEPARYERCQHCRYWYHSLGAEECRRKAPAVFMAMTNAGPAFLSAWPTVKADQFCGEFAPILQQMS